LALKMTDGVTRTSDGGNQPHQPHVPWPLLGVTLATLPSSTAAVGDLMTTR
jgi:hypothetical protein